MLLMTAGLTLLHLCMLGSLPVSGDEAYYWQCARHPDWSYYDQPPLIIWMLGASTALLGIHETAARLPAVVIGVALALSVLWICRRLLCDRRSPNWILLALLATPLFAIGTMYTSTDILLCWFALVVPALAAAAIAQRRPRLWLLVGLLGGLGGLAKFSAGIYVPVVLLLALLNREGRSQLRRPEPYLGVLLGLVAVSPALIWAFQNGFDNVAYQLVYRHYKTGEPLKQTAEYLGGQLILVSPLLFPILLTGLFVETRRALREKDVVTQALGLTAWAYLLFFLFTALRAKAGPHWAAPAYIPGAIVVVRWVLGRWSAWSRGRRAFIKVAIGFGLVLSVLAHAFFLFHQHVPREITYGPNTKISTNKLDRIYGWRDLVSHLRSLEGETFDPRRDAIVSDSYTVASMIAFYSEGRYDPMLMASRGKRTHGMAYLYWQDPSRYVGRSAIYVGRFRNKRTVPGFRDAFGSYTELGTFVATVDGGEGQPRRPAQSWKIVRGESLSADPERWDLFTLDPRPGAHAP